MQFARLAASTAMLVMLPIAYAAANPVTVTADVNLRKGPGTANDIITLIPKGSMVDVGTCTYGWCQVNFNGQDGYSIATNLGMGGPVRRPPPGYLPPPDADYPPPPGYVVGPPVYYGPAYYGPCCYGGYYGGGWGWRGGWRRHW
jgi:hypothetical protein